MFLITTANFPFAGQEWIYPFVPLGNDWIFSTKLYFGTVGLSDNLAQSPTQLPGENALTGKVRYSTLRNRTYTSYPKIGGLQKKQMIILITGASHTGKTLLAQRLMEKYKFPYFSIDLLKMGLIRSGNTILTPEDDVELMGYLWPIVREMIKTALENQQNLIVEGCYIPFRWEEDFDSKYRNDIRFYCLAMTASYIDSHFDDIKKYANAIEHRLDDSLCTKDSVRKENSYHLDMCRKYGCNCILIHDSYPADLTI